LGIVALYAYLLLTPSRPENCHIDSQHHSLCASVSAREDDNNPNISLKHRLGRLGLGFLKELINDEGFLRHVASLGILICGSEEANRFLFGSFKRMNVSPAMGVNMYKSINWGL
jgi:hypothetical protein